MNNTKKQDHSLPCRCACNRWQDQEKIRGKLGGALSIPIPIPAAASSASSTAPAAAKGKKRKAGDQDDAPAAAAAPVAAEPASKKRKTKGKGAAEAQADAFGNLTAEQKFIVQHRESLKTQSEKVWQQRVRPVHRNLWLIKDYY